MFSCKLAADAHKRLVQTSLSPALNARAESLNVAVHKVSAGSDCVTAVCWRSRMQGRHAVRVELRTHSHVDQANVSPPEGGDKAASVEATPVTAAQQQVRQAQIGWCHQMLCAQLAGVQHISMLGDWLVTLDNDGKLTFWTAGRAAQPTQQDAQNDSATEAAAPAAQMHAAPAVQDGSAPARLQQVLGLQVPQPASVQALCVDAVKHGTHAGRVQERGVLRVRLLQDHGKVVSIVTPLALYSCAGDSVP